MSTHVRSSISMAVGECSWLCCLDGYIGEKRGTICFSQLDQQDGNKEVHGDV